MKKWLLVAAGIVLLGIGVLGIPTSALHAFILPEAFQSVARLKIEQPSNAKSGRDTVWEPDWVATEAEVFLSKRVLTNAAAHLHLEQKWAEQFKEEGTLPPAVVYALLKNQVEVRRVGKTAILEVRVYSEDRNEAANIANEIARVYRDQRAADAQRLGGADSANPKPVTIVDAAEPSLHPARSKLRLMLPGIGISTILILAGAALLFFASRIATRTMKT